MAWSEFAKWSPAQWQLLCATMSFRQPQVYEFNFAGIGGDGPGGGVRQTSKLLVILKSPSLSSFG